MTAASKENLDQWVADLGSKDVKTRTSARAALVRFGSLAVPALLGALDAPEKPVRWEAAKALTEIADPSSAERLATALGDKDTDVRWVVGEALIALGGEAVKPLLKLLTNSDLPAGVYPGAHHVLHDLIKRPDLAAMLTPVLKALDQVAPETGVPMAAAKALQEEGG